MKFKSKKIAFSVFPVLFFAFATLGTICAQSLPSDMPHLIKKDGRHVLIVDSEPFLILGGQCGNSSAWPEMLPNLWKVMEDMHANTLEIPIYWEQLEPIQEQYDFSMIQTLLDQAQEHHMRLVLLWFGTWKNGSNHYMPVWMKKNAAKYPNITGKDGKPVDSPSPHSQATLQADCHAFAQFMGYLKKADTHHTVIMMQVENEPGTWGSMRDYSANAQKLFEQSVPKTLLNSAVLKQLNIPAGTKGTWSEVFGNRADEYFHAWSVASFIEQVAKAGKAVYPIPMYVNVALRDPLTNPMATEYESGGATDNVIPIWKVAAPSIDLLAPDIYLQGDEKVLKVIDLYARDDNALMVPETYSNTKYLYSIISRGICYSPFGVDTRWRQAGNIKNSVADEYKILSPMSRQLAKWSFEGRTYAVIEPQDHSEQRIGLGNWEAVITFENGGHFGPAQDKSKLQSATGKVLIIKLNDDEFITTGINCHITFVPIGINKGKAWQYLQVKEGRYEEGQFKATRILNGDQTDWGGPSIGEEPVLLDITLTTR